MTRQHHWRWRTTVRVSRQHHSSYITDAPIFRPDTIDVMVERTSLQDSCSLYVHAHSRFLRLARRGRRLGVKHRHPDLSSDCSLPWPDVRYVSLRFPSSSFVIVLARLVVVREVMFNVSFAVHHPQRTRVHLFEPSPLLRLGARDAGIAG